MNKFNQYMNMISNPRTRDGVRGVLSKLIDNDYRINLSSFETLAKNTDGGILKAGTAAAPITRDTANYSFVKMYCDNGAASGDNRLAYLRLYLTGAGTGGGETIRAFTTVNANIANAHGAHISLNFAATAGGSECSGLGAAVRGTLHIPAVASWAPTGTLCAGMFEIYSDGATSDPAGLTELSVLRLCNSGDGTGLADVDTDGFLFSVQGFTAASGVTNVLSSTSLAELPGSSVGLRVKIGTGTYYIPAVVSTEWN
jgi:hypothetical protein